MKLIGFLLNLAAITALVLGEQEKRMLALSPSEEVIVRYTNESLIVQCRSASPEVKLLWRSPKDEIISDRKGRIHTEQPSADHLTLVFGHISLKDRGNWSCEDAGGSYGSRLFDLMVYQKITFTENATVMSVREGRNATILCEVRGEPQPNITWYFNGQPINFEADALKFRILADGLVVNSVSQNDSGEYMCRAYQVNTITSDVQERTVLMKIEHKPFWTHKHHLSLQYAYMNGSVTIGCEAIAEPPANFTWHRNRKRLHNDRQFAIEADHYMSSLTIQVFEPSVFDTYRCRAQNGHGFIERTTNLEEGVKPPPPTVLQLRGFNSNTFDVDVGPVRTSPVRLPMEVNGYRIEYMSEQEFKADGGKWTNAKRKDFPFEDGATFLINNLEANVTYFMRAASRNLAGLSDWTKVEKFRTLSNEPPSSGGGSQISQALRGTWLVCWIATMLGVVELACDMIVVAARRGASF